MIKDTMINIKNIIMMLLKKIIIINNDKKDIERRKE